MSPTPAASGAKALSELADELEGVFIGDLRVTRKNQDTVRQAAQALRALADMRDTCLIWSNEHSAWWRADSQGYTKSVATAGKYPRAEALKICINARDGWREGKPPSEIPVRLDDIIVCVSSEVRS